MFSVERRKRKNIGAPTYLRHHLRASHLALQSCQDGFIADTGAIPVVAMIFTRCFISLTLFDVKTPDCNKKLSSGLQRAAEQAL